MPELRNLLRYTGAAAFLLAAAGQAAAPGAKPANAVPAASQAVDAGSSAAACPDGRDLSKVRVQAVAGPRSADSMAARPPVVALRQEIVLQVRELATLLELAKCSTAARKIVLFLDGRPVSSAAPYPPSDPQSGMLRFQLERTEDSRSVWTHLLGRPTFKPRDVPVSVGFDDGYPVPSDAKMQLEVIPTGWFWAWTVVLALLLSAFIALATKSDVIRDSVVETAGTRKPYSLAKMQAAWWFFLILASYLFIGLVTGDYNTSITGTVLSLMGISAATAVGSAVIDASRRSGATIATSGTEGSPVSLPAGIVTRGRWWLDIVSDENGVNFHRFQMAAWTAVLGVIFVHEVYAGLAMPTFDNTLLALLGISSGTYLGLKTTIERKT